MSKTPAQFICHATPLTLDGAAELPTEIELIPTGELRLRDRAGRIGDIDAKITDANAVVVRSMAAAAGGMIPIDFDHGIDELGTKDGKAAGWITGMRASANRIIADVQWTASGKAALEGRDYRFISPVFYTNRQTQEVTHVARAALTNFPALPELKILASSKENNDMPQWLKDLAAKLGMPDETDEAKITAAADQLIDQAQLLEPIIAAAGLSGDLTEAGATAIVTKMTASAKSGDDPDPAKFVAMADFAKLNADFVSLQKQVSGDTAEQLVASAMEAGKIAPASKEPMLKLAAADPAAFKAMIASAPEILKDGELLVGQPPVKEGELTADEKKVCAATGVTEAAFLATKAGKSPVEAKKEA